MCPNCNAPIRGSDSEFCTNCGARVRTLSPQSPPTQGQPPQFQGQAPPTQPAPGGSAGQFSGAPVPGQPGPVSQPGPGFAFDFKRLALPDRIIGGACIVAFLSLFLPWFGILGYSVSGLSLHGYLVIALLAQILTLGYLALRAGWDALPTRLPVAHAPLLLIGTGVQLLFMLIAFLQADGLSHEFGSYLGLLAALVACGVIAVPAIQSARTAPRG
jgi:hypothetical protein